MNKTEFDPCIFCKSMINYFKGNTNYDSIIFEDLYQECVLKTLELLQKDVYINRRFLALNLKRYLAKYIMATQNIPLSKSLYYSFKDDEDVYYSHYNNFTLLDFVIISLYKKLRKKSITKVSNILGIPKNIVKNVITYYKDVLNV